MGLLDFVEENSFEEAKRKSVHSCMHPTHPTTRASLSLRKYVFNPCFVLGGSREGCNKCRGSSFFLKESFSLPPLQA
jgi:hypothetical protein